MSRPARRSLRMLPTLEPRTPELETCAFCPKLCRTTCPVSNAEPRETLIPWGKMTASYALALGDRPMTEENAAPAWACTGCLACTEACDHENPVAPTLFESRAALMARGVAPESAQRVVREHASREAEASHAARALGRASMDSDAPLLLVGCAYLRKLPDTAANAVAVARTLLGSDVRVYEGCCGLPLLHAGDHDGFHAGVARVFEAAKRGSRLVVVDPGCAQALTSGARDASSRGSPRVELLVDLAAAELERFRASSARITTPDYHDPCSLGRGLKRYDEPRRLLARLVGAPPHEFVHARERGLCSGAGGLLAVTMPEVSATIARTRLADAHAPEAGRPIVTACASSLLAFRRAGKVAYDLCDLLARGLEQGESPP